MGLVSQVFTPRMLKEELAGHAAIGHVRYSTTGSSKLCNAQPLLRQYAMGPVAVAHNGNLINAQPAAPASTKSTGTSSRARPTPKSSSTCWPSPAHVDKPDPLPHVLKHLQGAFSLLFLFPDRIEAVRDPWGIRPLVARARPPDGHWCVASETCAFDAIDADVRPRGRARRDRPHRRQRPVSAAATTSRADERRTASSSTSISPTPRARSSARTCTSRARRWAGNSPAKSPVQADFVMPMPDSGRCAALGFAKESGIPFEEGIVPNRFVGRTFILPSQAQRDRAVAHEAEHHPRRGARTSGSSIVEDSVVRGTTTRSKMRALRRAGAKEIHLRVSCPPIRHPCFYGIDFPTSEELIAHNRTVEQIRDFLEVDSLAYLSLDGMLACMRQPHAALLHGVLERAVQDPRSTSRRASSASSGTSCRMF